MVLKSKFWTSVWGYAKHVRGGDGNNFIFIPYILLEYNHQAAESRSKQINMRPAATFVDKNLDSSVAPRHRDVLRPEAYFLR